MRYISTNTIADPVSFSEAVFRGMAEDGGLYVPEKIPLLPKSFWSGLENLSFHEIAYEMARPYLDEDLDSNELRKVIRESFTFDAPIEHLHDDTYVMELFHGPTLAFKDFGARFMSRVFASLGHNKGREISILVATSGDTGSAVAQGFKGIEGIKVFLLYPQGKVSRLQEQQITTAGGNVTAIEVDGTFDDCQRMVKQAFADEELRKSMTLSSANSINFARLLPQSFYYAYACSQLQGQAGKKPVFSVPSGNMGNLTGGLLAMKMGMPVRRFIAATNDNRVVTDYLRNGIFTPKASVKTVSNAMDVGNPSNLSRLRYLFKDEISDIRRSIESYSFNDDETRKAIGEVFRDYDYILDPHTAVGYLAGRKYMEQHPGFRGPMIVMATAHPAKFGETVEPEIGQSVKIPERLRRCLEKQKKTVELSSQYEDLRDFLENFLVSE